MKIPERVSESNKAMETLKSAIEKLRESATEMAESAQQIINQVREIKISQITDSEVERYKTQLLKHAVEEFSFTEDELFDLTSYLTDSKVREYIVNESSFDRVLSSYCLSLGNL